MLQSITKKQQDIELNVLFLSKKTDSIFLKNTLIILILFAPLKTNIQLQCTFSS